MKLWAKDSPQALAVRRKYKQLRESDSSDKSDTSDKSDSSDESDAWWILSEESEKSEKSDQSDPYQLSTATPEVAANTLICLTHQARYLLRRQLDRLQQDFLEKGGFTERLYWQRKKRRGD